MKPRFLIAFIAPLQLLHAQQDFTTSFTGDREYFILRSGNARMIIQSDRSGSAPAVTYMLFDAGKPCQTRRKERAFNYTPGSGCVSSALTVMLGGTAFTPLGHNTRVRWTKREGIPTVEARWWAGGFQITELFTPLENAGAFLRTINVRGADIAGTDTVRLRLSVPDGRVENDGSTLIVFRNSMMLAVGMADECRPEVDAKDHRVETGRIVIAPGEETTVRTLIATQIPASGAVYAEDCDDEKAIPPQYLHPGVQDNAAKGLKAEYFNNPALKGLPAVTRVDTNLCPYWDTSSPPGLSRSDSFSVRWTGILRPPTTGTYTMSLVADDRARLFIDNRLVVDCWESSVNVTKRGEVSLVAGKACLIRVEFAELAGWAGMRLKWSPPAMKDDEKEIKAGIAGLLAKTGELLHTQAVNEREQTKNAWRRFNVVSAADSLISSLYLHATSALPGMVADNGRMDAGIFEYGLQWVRDGSNVALGLIHAGQFEAARSILSAIVSDLISDEGMTIIAGAYDLPDREELDQMGELMHALKAYQDWTGDSSLLRNNRSKIIAMIERPLRPEFLDSTGMVHGRREYWERTFDDAYELAYQTFMIRGLRDAADLAPVLGVPGKAADWRGQADRILRAMTQHPTKSLVVNGALTKRRNVGGAIAEFVPGGPPTGLRDDPSATEARHRLDPDASYALPILLSVIDPSSDLARKTLDKLEGIWNARWDCGGYERYHSSSQQDQPGPWCFSTAYIARAQHDAGLYDRSRRSLEWLLGVPGGNAGAWFEEIPLNRSQMATAGVVPWASAEVATFVVRDWLGMRFEGGSLVISPRMFPGRGGCTASVRYRSTKIEVAVDPSGRLEEVRLEGRTLPPDPDGTVRID